jgi:hypothetical protein
MIQRRLFRAGQCGRRRGKKESLRRFRQMHAKHADGPEPGMVVHGSDRGATPWRAAPVRLPSVPSACFASIRLHLRKPLLASTRTSLCCDGPRTLRASQDPMHQFARLPPLRRPSEPDADIIEVLPEPHAPIHAAFSARQDSQGQATPHVQRAVARPAPPTVSPGAHLRRW